MNKTRTMDIGNLIKILEDSYCGDPFECPFNMYTRNNNGNWGCAARYPNLSPEDEDQGCIALQAAKMLKEQNDQIKILKAETKE